MQCDASRFKIEEWGKNGKTISTSKHVIKFKFNCSVRPFRTFDVSFDPESESTRIFVQMAQHPMSMSMSGLFGPFFPFPVGFARFVFPIFPIFPLLFAFLFDFFLTMCSKEWPCRESKTLKTKSTCSPLFPLFRPHHPHPHHPSPVNFSKGTGIHTRRIEELQLQSCQAMSGHVRPYQVGTPHLLLRLTWIFSLCHPERMRTATTTIQPNESKWNDKHPWWKQKVALWHQIFAVRPLSSFPLPKHAAVKAVKEQQKKQTSWGIHEYHHVSASHLGFHFHLESGTRHYGTVALWTTPWTLF